MNNAHIISLLTSEDSLSSTTIIGLVVRWGQYVYHPRQCHRDEVAADEDGQTTTTSRSFSFPKGDDGTRINTLEKSALGEGDGYESNLDGANNVKWEHISVVSLPPFF